MKTRDQLAVQKASRQRLLDDMRRAAWLVANIQACGQTVSWHRGFILGACEYASATRRACLLTAFGS